MQSTKANPAATGIANGADFAQLGGRSVTTIADDRLPVYSDGVLIGWLRQRLHGLDAVTLRGVSLGRYNTTTAAALALIERAAQ